MVQRLDVGVVNAFNIFINIAQTFFFVLIIFDFGNTAQRGAGAQRH